MNLSVVKISSTIILHNPQSQHTSVIFRLLNFYFYFWCTKTIFMIFTKNYVKSPLCRHLYIKNKSAPLLFLCCVYLKPLMWTAEFEPAINQADISRNNTMLIGYNQTTCWAVQWHRTLDGVLLVCQTGWIKQKHPTPFTLGFNNLEFGSQCQEIPELHLFGSQQECCNPSFLRVLFFFFF